KRRDYFPLEVLNFVKATSFDKKIHVLLINMGMLNSKTMSLIYDDSSLFGSAETPFDLVSRTKPFVIIDEPHKFKRGNESFKNILKFKPQTIIRYGATFPELTNGDKDYENLLYDLDAVKAFNDDLVKGVSVFVPKFEGKKNAKLTFINSDGKLASFKYIEGNKEKTYRLGNGQSLSQITSEFHDIEIEKLNKSVVELSNGIVLEKQQSIHPSSFSDTYQEVLMKKAIDAHFEKEMEYFNLPSRIKPLTLFFIDEVDSYREKVGRTPYIKNTFEKLLKQKTEYILEHEDIGEEYRSYLEASLASISKTHGGYFSKDNSDKDEKIQEQIEEILQDKVKLLSYEFEGKWNVRRFIFSKWTLKEGWDNPNVFTICKLRSSGSEISKLQEVGRGLRLPVNESLFRVKSSQFELSYIVDFTEQKFAESLVKEINNSATSIDLKVVTDTQFKFLAKEYNSTEDEIFAELLGKKIINRHGEIQDNKLEELYTLYPKLRKSLKPNKVRSGETAKQYVTVRKSNYEEFKKLWETINQKVFIEYHLGTEEEIKSLLVNILKGNPINQFDSIKIAERKIEKSKDEKEMVLRDIDSSTYSRYEYVETIPYHEFLKIVSKSTFIPLPTIHQALVEYHQFNSIDNNTFFTRKTALNLIKEYKNRIADVMLSKIEYKQLDVDVHPTALTNTNGTLKKVAAHDVGTKYLKDEPQSKYLYNEFFYDSNENETINEQISEVIVFGKIPKRSIRIPVINGQTYSPDFAYVVNQKDGKTKLNIVIESKNKEERGLSIDEKDKISLANRFFDAINQSDIKVEFQEQLEGQYMSEIIYQILKRQ
ncbi:type III restriction-modification system endonuclease, partial [Virgibacillus sp. FSP13]